MKIVLLSNYFNHHQKAFCEMMYQRIGNNFTFISTVVMREERRRLGYADGNTPEYVLLSYMNEKNAKHAVELIDSADIVIVGSAPEILLQNRKKSKKIIFRYSERPLKRGFEIWKYPIRWCKWHKNNSSNSSIYMLCASAYTAGDYTKFGLFKNKMYKWGYFPECKKYDRFEELLSKKDSHEILWCGRFLDWKHPDDILVVAKRLKNEGYDFHINIIGNGEMEAFLKEYCESNNIFDVVTFMGSMSPEKVREHMERAGIYLFTSDRKEGWGAVLNESMNSGCGIIASHEIGAVPYLIKDNENGLIYESGNIDMLYEKVKYLLSHLDEQKRLGTAAYQTIINEWNAEIATERFLKLAKSILERKNNYNLFKSGLCSNAEIVKDNWFRG